MRYYGFEPTLIIGAVISILIIVAIAYVVVRQGFGKKETRHQGNDAMDILNRRFASGEISDEEYEKKKKLMGG